MANNIRYFYIRNEKMHPVATVAWEQDGAVVKYAVSVWNPLDRFNRKQGRMIAHARLVTGRPTNELIGAFTPLLENTLVGAQREIMVKLMENSCVPWRVRKHIRRFLLSPETK